MAGIFDGKTNRTGYAGISVSGKVVFQDGGSTISPKTAIGTNPFEIVSPDNAVVLTFRPTGDIRYGDNGTLDGTLGHGYKKASSGADITIPCNSMPSIYVRAESGTVDVDFYFEVLVF